MVRLGEHRNLVGLYGGNVSKPMEGLAYDGRRYVRLSTAILEKNF